ncbi:hypothetical protein Dimus_010310 [Dionaea muscipula]
MSVVHLKKKDVVKTSVKGVVIEFDHLKLASILGIPGNNGISFGVPLLDKKGEEPKRYDYFEETFHTMLQGESGSDDQFFDAQVDVEEPVTETPAAPAFLALPGDSLTQ